MQTLIGRLEEKKVLQEALDSEKSEFIAVYGRRRVGKTYLIRQFFQDNFAFQFTGIANISTKDQLGQFHAALIKADNRESNFPVATTWFEAFRQLVSLIEADRETGKKIIFLDELPWIDTRNSKFIPALEHFWNSWASARTDILLITCGSAASWMVKNLLNSRGGLHNRVTERLKLEPFSLAEVELFLNHKNIVLERYQTILLYMVFGGIPFYLDKIRSGQSATQNINRLCFSPNALFRSEYENLYKSLFTNAEKHILIIEALAQKNKGLTRSEIIKYTKIPNGGGLSRLLNELEESSFIRSYRSMDKRKKDKLFQLVDLYSLFYLNFIEKSDPTDEYFWINKFETPAYNAWSGYAFEMVCLHHIQAIKKALGIHLIQTSVASWHGGNAQIDLVIDRKDKVINLFEMKFSQQPFAIDKKYAENLRNKVGNFRADRKTQKALFLSFISTYGLAQNAYSGMVQNSLTMDVLFE